MEAESRGATRRNLCEGKNGDAFRRVHQKYKYVFRTKGFLTALPAQPCKGPHSHLRRADGARLRAVAKRELCELAPLTVSTCPFSGVLLLVRHDLSSSLAASDQRMLYRVNAETLLPTGNLPCIALSLRFPPVHCTPNMIGTAALRSLLPRFVMPGYNLQKQNPRTRNE